MTVDGFQRTDARGLNTETRQPCPKPLKRGAREVQRTDDRELKAEGRPPFVSFRVFSGPLLSSAPCAFNPRWSGASFPLLRFLCFLWLILLRVPCALRPFDRPGPP